MMIKTFEDVVAWQKSRLLYSNLHLLLKDCKDFSYKNQMMRASLSIMNNIAEGFDRGSNKELKQFLIIARGSAAEVRSMLLVAEDLELINKQSLVALQIIVKDISRLLTGFIKAIN